MLRGMLVRATQGHTDGHAHRGATSTSTATSTSPVPWHRSWRMVLGADKVFASWLRAMNDRSMRCQVEGCHAILEAIERMEEGEKRGGGGGAGGTAIDVQAYMQAWGLDALIVRDEGGDGGNGRIDDGHGTHTHVNVYKRKPK